MNSSIFKWEGPAAPGKKGLLFKLKVYVVAIVAGLLFGYNTAIIAGAIPYISVYFKLEGWALGWAVGCMFLGCAAGSLIAGILADKFGRRRILIVCAVFFAVTGLVAGASHHLNIFKLSRFVGGLGIGAVVLLAPLYLSELAPPFLKGRLVAFYQLAIVFGILLAYLSCSSLYGVGLNNWRWMLASQLILSVLFLLLVGWLPETPGQQAKDGKVEKAMATLVVTIGSFDGAAKELSALEDSFIVNGPVYFKHLFKPPYRRRLFIGILVGVCQQLTGINAVLYYAPLIFKEMGADAAASSLQTIGMGVVIVITAFLAIRPVDKMSRKNIMLAGSSLMGFSLAIVAACFQNKYFDSYVIRIFLFLYVGIFSCTLGTATWLYLAEIFPGHIRGWAMSIAILALWLADFAVTLSFPAMSKYLGMPLTLLCYACMCGVVFLLIRWKVQETNGLSVEEINIPG